MTKKKAIKKKAIKKAEVIVKEINNTFVEIKNKCVTCKHFSINGEGATRGRCHRYPSATPTTIQHYCGEYE